MHRRTLVLLLLTFACGDSADPNSTGTWVAVSNSLVRVAVDDSVEVRAQLRDIRGDPISGDLTFTIDNATIADVAEVSLVAEEVIYRVRGTALGVSVFTVVSEFGDSAFGVIESRAAGLELVGLPDTMISGTTAQLTTFLLSATGARLRQTTPTYQRGSLLTVDSLGLVTACCRGEGTVGARTPLLNTFATTWVKPAEFDGLMSADTLATLDTLILWPPDPQAWAGSFPSIGIDGEFILDLTTGPDSTAALMTAPPGTYDLIISGVGERGTTMVTPLTLTPPRVYSRLDPLPFGTVPGQQFGWADTTEAITVMQVIPDSTQSATVQLDWYLSGLSLEFDVEDCNTGEILVAGEIRSPLNLETGRCLFLITRLRQGEEAAFRVDIW